MAGVAGVVGVALGAGVVVGAGADGGVGVAFDGVVGVGLPDVSVESLFVRPFVSDELDLRRVSGLLEHATVRSATPASTALNKTRMSSFKSKRRTALGRKATRRAQA